MRENSAAKVLVAAMLFLGAAGVAAAGDRSSLYIDSNGVQHVTVAINNNDISKNNRNINSNDNTDVGGSIDSSRNGNESIAAAVSVAGASASAESEGGGAGSSDVTVDGDETPPSSAAPVFLSVGDDTCMGSGALGVQSLDLGLSVGSSWTDSNCVMLKNARELKNQGYHKAAKARLCMDEDNALAFELAGEPCPRALPSTQAALARIRAWNPDYERATVAAAQIAARDSTAAVPGAGQEVALLAAPATREETAWLSRGVESLLALAKTLFAGLASGIPADAAASDTLMDGLE